MNDMSSAIVPKSDQLNSDDLIAGPITIKITGVIIKSGEQPVSISYAGDNGKPYKCCKSMARILVAAWGADASKYTGRSLTLYRDPSVRWAGMEVGGIRISHMSDIDAAMTMALTMTKSNRKPFTVRPLVATEPKAAPSPNSDAIPPGGESDNATGAATITADEALALEARATDNGIPIARIKKAYGVERLSALTPEQLVEAHMKIDETLAKRKADLASQA